ncbi:MAG: DUF1186 domain-containing protein [Bacteroidales bacterium]|nr:DUF1186 domain-containing protein [Bacteroidales bacterium]
MAKKKNKGNGQQFLSADQYIRQKARTLKIGKCYISNEIEQCGEGDIIVTREHTGGKISMGIYLVDIFCLGVKDSFYYLRHDEYELKQIISGIGDMRECSYEEAHNWIYGAIAFAEEAGIEPHKSFRLTQFMLEEDSDEIPLIEYEFGRDGKHCLICNNQNEMNKYLPVLKKNLGDDFDYILPADGADDYNDDDELPDIDMKEVADLFKNMKDNPLFKQYGPETEYTYKHPQYPTELNLTTPEWFYNELNSPANKIYLNDDFIDRILQLPHDLLRENLEKIILYHIGQTCDSIPDESENDSFTGIVSNSIILLGEVGNAGSLDIVLETLRQNEDFYDYHFGDAGDQIFTSTIYLLAHRHLDKLLDFVKEEGLYTYAKYNVFPAVTQIALRQPERRDEVLEWYREVLVFAAEVLPETKYIDSSLSGLLLSNLLDIQAKELLPEIKKMFDTNLVDLGACGDYKTICKDICDKRKVGFLNNCILDIHERFADMKKTWDR